MTTSISGRRLGRVFAVPVVSAALLIGLGPGTASAAACAGWTMQSTPSPGSSSNFLSDVAATSSTNAWVVGSYINSGLDYHTLIEHWNGSAWKQQASPNPGSSPNMLNGVAATSATNAWAVGSHFVNGGLGQTLIAQWNGTGWKQQSSPSPGSGDSLSGVAAISATNAWAVGSYYNGTNTQTLIEHWNGSAWKQVTSANVSGTDNELLGVAVVSPTNIWAVGDARNQTLIEHWNGSAWKQVPSPNPNSCNDSNMLADVVATSSTNAWAVGTDVMCPGSESQVSVGLIVHWNGSAWKQQTSQSPNGRLGGVAATSSTNAWAVGGGAAIAHWNGSAWKQQASPNPGSSSGLNDVAATSATNAWAVGGYSTNHGRTTSTLALHRC